MGKSIPSFFCDIENNTARLAKEIFAEQYAEEYAKIRLNEGYRTIDESMIIATERTKEFLYYLLKKELKVIPIWPREFVL